MQSNDLKDIESFLQLITPLGTGFGRHCLEFPIPKARCYAFIIYIYIYSIYIYISEHKHEAE